MEERDSEQKPVLAIDVDEVLAFFIPSLVDFHNEAYESELTPQSFHSYDFCKVWGGTPEDSYTKMDAFYKSHHFQERLRPIPHAMDTLLQLKERFDLHVVTSRQFAIQEATLQWIEDHYPGLFNQVHFGNHYSREGKVRSKPEICKDIGAVLLIDDSLQYAYQCHSANIPVLLFGEYAWNQKHSVQPSLFKDGDINIHPFDLDAHTTAMEIDMDVTRTLFRVHDWRHVAGAIDFVLHHHSKAQVVYSPSQSPTPTPSERLRVAAIQMCSVDNKLTNLRSIYRLVRRAVSEGPGATLVCLPECCVFMGQNGDQTVAAAEPILRDEMYPEARCEYDIRSSAGSDATAEKEIEYDGVGDINSIAALCEIAHANHVWLSVGGFPERRVIDGAERMSNTHIVITPEGKLAAHPYRKIHLFDAPLVGLQESRTTVAGDALIRVGVADWAVGVTVCYDVRFPGLFQALAAPELGNAGKSASGEEPVESATRGAEIFLVPAAFTRKTGEPHWEVLLRARAIETQSYVIAAAQSGAHNERRTSYGHTMIIDPWGTIVAHLHDEDEGICYGVLDKSFLHSTRNNMPVQSHVRRDLY